jgi:hypothetical protein
MALPAYLLAADNHNLANNNTSWLNPLDWGDKLGNVGKFTVSAITSGVSSIYNSGAAAGNFFGADIEEMNTASTLAAFDSDFAQYYQQNKESIDLVGFIGSSLIPGFAGIKALNLGQNVLRGAINTGKIGGNLAKPLGLLTPKTSIYVDLAAAEINASVGAARLLNAQAGKAIASGFWQNTLEAAAAETFIQATLFKSPVLEQQTVSDVAWNIAIGGAVGGVIGGAFSVAKIRGQLKEAVTQEDILRQPYTVRPAFAEKTTPSERIVSLAWDAEMSTVPILTRNADGTIPASYGVSKELYEGKIKNDFLDIRTQTHKLSDDVTVGNMLANGITPVPGELGYSSRYLENFHGAVAITRADRFTKIELDAAKAMVKGEIPKHYPASRFVRLVGEGAGETLTEAPLVKSLGDIYAGKESIHGAIKDYGFTTKTTWNAAALKGVKAHLEGEARHIWASKMLPKIPEGTIIHANDIPLLERAFDDKFLDIKIVSGEGIDLVVTIPASVKQLEEILVKQKVDVANDLLREMSYKGGIPVEFGTEAIAKIVNTRKSYLEGTISANSYDDLFAHQGDKKKYFDFLAARKISLLDGKLSEGIDPHYLPKHAKIVYDLAAGNTPENVSNAVSFFKAQQQIYQDEAKIVASRVLGNAIDQLPDISDAAMVNANRLGASPGLFSSQNNNYGTLGSSMAKVGSVTRDTKQVVRTEVSKQLESPLVRLGEKQEAAFEFEGFNQKASRSGKLWVRYSDDDGANYMVTREVAKKIEAGIIEDFGDELIPIVNRETWDAITVHISETGKRTVNKSEIRAQQGHTDSKDPNVFRPIRPDLRNYPHFAFVSDPRVTGAGHTTMIHAASEKELAELARRVPPEYEVRFKKDTEDFYRARQEYDYQRTLNENYIDSDLASKGVFSNFFPKSDPQKIIDDILQQHFRESDVLVQEAVRLRYEPLFSFLEDQGKNLSKAETSRFASRARDIEETSDNPFFNYIKTALDISKAPENKLIYGFNKLLDESVSKAVGSIQETFFSKVKSPADLELINAQLDKFGLKPAYYDAALQALANHTAPKGELTKFVRRANSLLSLFTLGLDPLNAVNNAIGSNILRFTELGHITRAIKEGNTKVAGELALLTRIKLPGVEQSILSPTKLVAQAIKNYFKDDGTILNIYRAEGIIKSREDQLKMLIDDFTLKGTESVSDLESRISGGMARLKGYAEKGEKLSLNAHAEEFNRFLSANVMDQISDVAVANGLMTQAEAKAYRNTFVNRVEGNIIASQRPLIFQGPIGQAISLFQSYQFNLIQQLFRYVAEGSKKDLAMLAGLQSTLYGIQSLPAFQFINTHIIGQLSGNKEHRDTYDAVYGTVGKTAGDFVLYGLPSNILLTNIYSRGDINPRHLTILPTSLQEIPIVQGYGKFFASLFETAGKIAGGGNAVESLLQGIEHNGISRPLAGLAQTLQAIPSGTAYSTSGKGSILYSNDLFHLATLSRLAGGRPLDEAVANDALFRIKSYDATRRAQMLSLSERVKSTLIGDETSSDEQVMRFAQQYAELGGKQAGFNKWMMELYKSTNVPQTQQLANSLKTPFAYKMQLLMGGSDE